MTYKLKFKKQAVREWRKLDDNLRAQFKKKIIAMLDCPCLPGARLSGSDNRYKIKLRNAGYRLVYEVRKEEIVIVVIALGRRDHGHLQNSCKTITALTTDQKNDSIPIKIQSGSFHHGTDFNRSPVRK